MRLTSLVHSHALVASVALATASAWAQTPAPAPTPAAPAPAGPAATPAPVTPPAPVATPDPAPAPADAMAPAPAPAEEAAPVGAAVVPAAPVEEEETFPAAWMRLDSDLLGFQAWAGATHMFNDTVGLATDIYLNAVPFLGEFDIGPTIVAGPMYITPMIGLQMDWSTRRAASIVPQLFVTGGPDPIYTELWLQWYNYAAFKDPGLGAAGTVSYLYGRFFLNYKAHKYVAFGPQIEFQIALNDAARRPLDADEIAAGKTEGQKLSYLPIGADVSLTNYGKNNTLILFMGYDVKSLDIPLQRHLTGRFSFIHNF
jgi:hypothetical protein